MVWSKRAATALILALVIVLFASPLWPSLAREDSEGGQEVTVILRLEGEPVAKSHLRQPHVAASGQAPSVNRLELDSPEAQEQSRRLRAEHDELKKRLASSVPEASIRAEYETVFNGVAVTLPEKKLGLLKTLPGVRSISQTRKLHPVLDTSVPLINAPAVWSQLGGPANAGLGIKIALIDTGIDQTHPFLTDNSLAAPAGFPKGDPSFTSNKVIVAKSYPPLGKTFTPQDLQGHGTHVAGIAAGVNGYVAPNSAVVSGVAPKAFLMNYNVFGSLVDADTSDIVRAVDDAVADGADVVNMSLGGPGADIDTDPLVIAVRNGIKAGVVFAIAAGNDGLSGAGTILFPGVTPEAITVGASTKSDYLAAFSSRGPNLDLSIKPDVTAPGVNIYSSVPGSIFGYKSGTSMATPHVAGAAALLKQLHPSWGPAEIKSALVNTAKTPVNISGNDASVMQRGSGRIDLAASSNAGLILNPPSYSFGAFRIADSGLSVSGTITATNCSDISGTWSVGISPTQTMPGLGVTASPSQLTLSPNSQVKLTITVTATNSVAAGDYEGYLSFANTTEDRHAPYWVRLSSSPTVTNPLQIYRDPVQLPCSYPYKTFFPLLYKNAVNTP
ncbi:MAG: S8 family serine peptidase [Dehalococcoidales bacterium]|nr:S8 family serine peptidase [Dehalococcoidales bacterium]